MFRRVPPLARLVTELSRLPGIGEKTASRLAYHIVQEMSLEGARTLAAAIVEAKEQTLFCSICFNLSDADPCPICRAPERETRLVCVVETPADLWAIEATGEFRGRYHVLHGTISPLKGRGPDDIRLAELLTRVEKEEIEEVLLATNLDVEGNTTALYIGSLLADLGIKVSRIAQGIPAGTDLLYADRFTLGAAIEGRKPIEER
ncbi:MAG: recombination protein RecR [Deltaproteobacteria bacterium]|nr:MAG: recombination protein RecR [Deltaproteobacteria bacterium]